MKRSRLFQQISKETHDASRNDWTGAYGQQYGPPASAEGPGVCYFWLPREVVKTLSNTVQLAPTPLKTLFSRLTKPRGDLLDGTRRGSRSGTGKANPVLDSATS